MLFNVQNIKNCRQSQVHNITMSMITCRAIKSLNNESQGKDWLFWTAETSSPDGKRGMLSNDLFNKYSTVGCEIEYQIRIKYVQTYQNSRCCKKKQKNRIPFKISVICSDNNFLKSDCVATRLGKIIKLIILIFVSYMHSLQNVWRPPHGRFHAGHRSIVNGDTHIDRSISG